MELAIAESETNTSDQSVIINQGGHPVALSLGFSASDEVFGTEDSENAHLKALDAAWNNPAALETIRANLRCDISNFGYISPSDRHEMCVALKLAAARIAALSH